MHRVSRRSLRYLFPPLRSLSSSIIHTCLHTYAQDVADASLQMTAVWCIGEFGEMLLQGQGELSFVGLVTAPLPYFPHT